MNAAISQQHAIVYGLTDKDLRSANVLVSRRATGGARGRRIRHDIFVSKYTSLPTGVTADSGRRSPEKSDAKTTIVESTSLFKAPWLSTKQTEEQRLSDSAAFDDESETAVKEHSACDFTVTAKQQKTLQVSARVRAAFERVNEEEVEVPQSTSSQSCVAVIPKGGDEGSDSDDSFESVDDGTLPVFTLSAPTGTSTEATQVGDKTASNEVSSEEEMTTVTEQCEKATQMQSSSATSSKTITNRDLQNLLHDEYKRSKASEAGVSDEIYQDCQVTELQRFQRQNCLSGTPATSTHALCCGARRGRSAVRSTRASKAC